MHAPCLFLPTAYGYDKNRYISHWTVAQRQRRAHRFETRSGLLFVIPNLCLSLGAVSQSLRYVSIPFRCLLTSRLCVSLETPSRLSFNACFWDPLISFYGYGNGCTYCSSVFVSAGIFYLCYSTCGSKAFFFFSIRFDFLRHEARFLVLGSDCFCSYFVGFSQGRCKSAPVSFLVLFKQFVLLYLLWILFYLKNTFNCKCNEFVQLLFVSKIIHQNQFQTEKC